VINQDLVTIVLADTLTKGERRLVDNGLSDRVLQLRHDYQLTMRDDLVAIVEGQLDRTVTAFMRQNHIDPDLAIEVFVLEPSG
jgi:predicted RecB family endonuclease